MHTLADLQAMGAVPAYAAVRRMNRGASLNLLYALAGAIDGVHWLEVRRERRLELLVQLEDHERGGAGRPSRK